MRNKDIALHGLAVLVGGLLATGATAQTEMASAVPTPQRDFLVFADKGGHLSPTAASTVRTAAAEAGSARVTLIGRPENVAPVKAELQRHGVAAKAIVVKTEAALPVARTADGLSSPADRKVEIKF
ncbi:MAG: hypothetical protein J0J01_23175 [Reyranella sp.]|uniref:hypothetical protein n=1 Tax=Reyranella sp. TaxID=1929291 RepID=UPI001AC7F92D|nr:hypothetical protein [Reyranella sp.]MBN9089825.1 hypothetical protein [Reyranella sp.]